MGGVSKNILMLHASSDLYGASRVLLQVAIILKEQGFQPILVISAPGPLQKAFEAETIKVYIRPLAILRRKYFNLTGLWNRFWTFMKAKRELSILIKAHEIDTIYTNTAGVWVGAVLAKKHGLRHLWHLHEIIQKPKFLTQTVSWLARRSSAEVLVVSDAVKEHWQLYLSKTKLRRIYNGFDFTYLDEEEHQDIPAAILEADLVIGMIARVHFWKGQVYFLEIAKGLKELGVKAKYVMVGDAFPGYEYLYDEINRKCLDLALEDDVIDLGFRKDIGPVLEALDLFILPSILPDPLPTTVLEAMSKGKPVVATAHGGALEMVIDQVTGLHIPWDDPTLAAERIHDILVDREQLVTMGKKGAECVEQEFSQNAFQKNILALIADDAG